MPFCLRTFKSVGVILLLNCALPVNAADWTFKPRLSVIQTHSNNLNLAPEGQETSQSVTQVNPGIGVSADGRRLQLEGRYNMQNLRYSDDSSLDRTNNQFSALLRSEPIKDWFYLDWSGRLTQQLLSPQNGLPSDNLTPDNGSRGDVVTTSISPQIRRKFGRDTDLALVYTEGWVNYEKGNASDSNTENLSFTLGRPRTASGVDWQLNASEARTIRENSNDFESRTIEGRVGFRVLPDTRFVAYAGREEGQISSSRNFEEGDYWSAGLYWQPSPKFSLELTKGDNDQQEHLNFSPNTRSDISISHIKREVGIRASDTWSADVSHRTKRSDWGLGYSEQITSDAVLAITNQEFQVLEVGGNIVFDARGVPVVVLANQIGVVDEEFIRAIASARIGYSTAKSRISLVLSDETRDYEISARHSESQSAFLNWNWKFAMKTSFNVGHRVTLTEEDGFSDRETTINTVTMTRTIGQKADARLMWRQADVEQGSPSNDYRETRISASLTIKF